ncbi:transposase [Comamonas testosteroni TK102]|uniref:Transposase n=1 Tax=Comamonas testosteroni TK102 TaxID=1392005 RepID=A0A076PUN5_COMTE|nr:transposase [Comamonas testosteroni TK102]
MSDEAALNGILFVLQTGIPWEDLPQSLGYGSGMTCWRCLRDWNTNGVWQRLHQALLVRLREHDQIDWNRASIAGSTVPSPRVTRKQALTPRIEASSAANGTSSWTPELFHWWGCSVAPIGTTP